MTDWRTRLLEAVDKDGRSDRAISLAAKVGPNFVNELRNTPKEPSVQKVALVAGELGLSLSYLFSGIQLSAEDEEAVQVFLSLSPESRQNLLGIARQLAKAAPGA